MRDEHPWLNKSRLRRHPGSAYELLARSVPPWPTAVSMMTRVFCSHDQHITLGLPCRSRTEV
jgi:hypothetical protein